MESFAFCGFCKKNFEENQKIGIIYLIRTNVELQCCIPCGKDFVSKQDDFGIQLCCETVYKKNIQEKNSKIEEDTFTFP